MTEKRYDDFDLEIKALLEDAEEEVPPQIWEAVSTRVQHRRREGVWFKRAGAAVAAAAAVAAILTLVRPSGNPSAQQDLIADNVATPVEKNPVIDEDTVSEYIVPEKKTTPTRRVKQIMEKDSDAPVLEQAAEKAEKETESAVEGKPEDNGTESRMTTEPASRENATGKKKDTGTPDPFAMMAYEDAHKSTKRFELDVKGIVGTNDNTSAVAGSRRMAANGIKTSKSYATIVEDGESIYGVPVTVGAGVKMHFAPRWAVSAGLDYTLLSRTFKGTYTDSDSRQFCSDNIKHSVQYIGLPVNLYYDILSADYVSMYAFAGGALEKGIGDKYVIPGATGTQTCRQDVPGLQWSAAAGLGVQFRLSNHLGLFADPGVRYYFACNQPKSIRTQQPLMFNLELGLRFDL